jgi:hypothetical protein
MKGVKAFTPVEVNQRISFLQKRGVKNTPSSELRRLIKLQRKHNTMLALVLPTSEREKYGRR